MTRPRVFLLGIGGLIAAWSFAALVALDDVDFFNPEDFFDLAHPHHEHIFVALVILGFVAALVPLVWDVRRG